MVASERADLIQPDRDALQEWVAATAFQCQASPDSCSSVIAELHAAVEAHGVGRNQISVGDARSPRLNLASKSPQAEGTVRPTIDNISISPTLLDVDAGQTRTFPPSARSTVSPNCEL
jgi:hypothetical protein